MSAAGVSTGDLGIAPMLHADDVTAWLTTVQRRLVPAGTAVPTFASPEWHKADDALRLASALQATKAYYIDGLYLPQRLEDEQARARWAQQSADTQEWAEIASWVRETANAPTHTELVERRREVVLPAAREAS